MTTNKAVLEAVDKFFEPDIRLYANEAGIVRSFEVLNLHGLHNSSDILDFVGSSVDDIERAIPGICWEVVDYDNQPEIIPA